MDNSTLKDFEDFTKRNYQEFHFVIVKDAIDTYRKKLHLDNQNKKYEALGKLSGKAPIVREHEGFIVLAQDEADFAGKCRKIAQGLTKGFYTIEAALEINTE